MAVHINILNGGNITVTLGSGGSTPSEHAETYVTYQDNSIDTLNIVGTLNIGTALDGNAYYQIKEIDIGNTVTSIERQAFYYLNPLIKVIIPSSVTSIGDEAFEGCDNLTTITVLGKTTSEAQTLLADANVPESCTIIGELG